MIVFLVPVGRSRFELYSETPDEAAAEHDAHEGTVRRWLRRASAEWQALVERARHGSAPGRLARWRDAAVCRLAETIAEQRTLWALRETAAATLCHPATVDAVSTQVTLTDTLARARRHHLRWFLVDLTLIIVQVPIALIPGPNVIAYYLAFRLIGHVQSWRGARQAMDGIVWTYEPDTRLAELATLADQPRESRAPRVAAIAAELNLPRLSAFFDRVAVRS